jgi:hypothetical protein
MKRPLSVTLISFLYILAGAAGIIYHASELLHLFSQPDQLWVLVVRVLAIVGGVFALRGANWARWLLMAWILYHVYLSTFHETGELIIHIILSVVTAVALFHRGANIFLSRHLP